MPTSNLSHFVVVLCSCSSPDCEEKNTQLGEFFKQFRITAKKVKQKKAEARRLLDRARRRILDGKNPLSLPLLIVFSGDEGKKILWAGARPSNEELEKVAYLAGNYA